MNHNSLIPQSICSRIVLLFCSICFFSIANAQQSAVTGDPRGGESKKPKVSADTWKLQAETVATKLGLSKEKSDQLVNVYQASREARKVALKELPKSDDASDDKAEMREEENVKQREQLKAAISTILSSEQIEGAILSLGSFNPRWDRYVSQIEEFQLDDQKKQDALQLTFDYIVDYGKARNAATAEGARFSSVSARTLKSSLDAGLAKLLSEEELTKWDEATAFRAGGTKRSAPGEGKREGKQGGRKNE
ncbi:hypothetical protein Pla144_49870 [Bythopirellula polymerisocia]|uniref:Uncharacterized protein n=2 Tax=Bythopirellula polymerisocia TaxID=2528003 RepID=A0A5C6C6S5_9BACT|nr:hypothetical protein Pla144_49870 [Bythopirellula polymerisocia]